MARKDVSRRTETSSVLAECLAVASNAPEFCEEALHPLPDGVGGYRVRLGDFFAGVSIQFDLNQKVQFSLAEKTVREAPMQKVPQQRIAFHGVVLHQRRGNLEFFRSHRTVDCSFATGPFKELPLHQAGNRENEVRVSLSHSLRTQDLEKNAQRLLGNIRACKVRLLFCDAAHGS